MRILVAGASGFLGGHFLRAFPESIGSQVDIADERAVAIEFDRHRPELVINCAGKTGRPNIDWCEVHRLETVRSNVTGPLVLLEACLRRQIRLVHLSSGCIYEGDRGGPGFTEDDRPNFVGSFYARTKALADDLLSDFPVLILRIRMVFDDTLHPRSLITKLAQYDRVLDEPNSLTHIPDLLDATKRLIEQQQTGIFHVVNSGTISPFDIMVRYCECVDRAHQFSRLPMSDLTQVTTTGRSNCVLSVEKLRRCNIVMPGIHEAIANAISAIASTTRDQRETV